MLELIIRVLPVSSMKRITPHANMSILGVCGWFSITSGATYPASVIESMHRVDAHVAHTHLQCYARHVNQQCRASEESTRTSKPTRLRIVRHPARQAKVYDLEVHAVGVLHPLPGGQCQAQVLHFQISV